MSGPYGFGFQRTKTCVLVGMGASVGLGYPSFCDQQDVHEIIAAAVALGNPGNTVEHQQRVRDLFQRVGPRFGWNLERMYEHLSHIPPFLHTDDLACNTEQLCDWLVSAVAQRLGEPPEPPMPQKYADWWQRLAQRRPHPIAVFTTNYDSVLEAALTGLDYADGWHDDWYRREHFAAEPRCDYALVKLHGSARWWRTKYDWPPAVWREPRTMDRSVSRRACMPPFRRKWATEEPYASGYDFLSQALGAADELLVVGFSWRDLSAATVLRGALEARKPDLPLIVHVFDRRPHEVEERVRLFLRESGAAHLLPQLKWHHHIGPFPELPADDDGTVRGELDCEVSLADEDKWTVLKGEPEGMIVPDGDMHMTVRWGQHAPCFESGRVVLLPALPSRFHAELSLTMVHYGSGWNPGVALEDAFGNEVLAARFLPKGHRDWHRADDGELNVDGIRVTRGLEFVRRDPVAAGAMVTAKITGTEDQTWMALLVDGEQVGEGTVAHHSQKHRPTRLHFGGYPWYSDDPITFHQEAECRFGPCVVKPA